MCPSLGKVGTLQYRMGLRKEVAEQMNEQIEKTYAEIMVEQLSKIADALEQLRSLPLPQELIMMYVQKRTRLAKRDIEAVFNAIEELNQKTMEATQMNCPSCGAVLCSYVEENIEVSICWNCGYYSSNSPAFKTNPDRFKNLVRDEPLKFLRKFLNISSSRRKVTPFRNDGEVPESK